MCTSLSECKSLAVRLHLWSSGSTSPTGSLNCDVLLHRAPPLTEDGTANTVGDFLNLAMPVLLHDGQLADGVEILLHGLQVPLETPLFWLALHASYLDHFVHLVARVPDKSFCDTPSVKWELAGEMQLDAQNHKECSSKEKVGKYAKRSEEVQSSAEQRKSQTFGMSSSASAVTSFGKSPTGRAHRDQRVDSPGKLRPVLHAASHCSSEVPREENWRSGYWDGDWEIK
eukprot:Skav227630  [mRNA]  locus=scaffold3692:15877:16705:+ [translate_table: standard]